LLTSSGSAGGSREASKATFCEQKAAKNFVDLGRVGFTATGPVKQKFLRRFF
jgi:hypothetical protein